MKKILTGLLLVICLVTSSLSASAQRVQTEGSDSAAISLQLEERVRTPKKASIYSAIFPGLGQIYNRKYWKLPIIYGGFAGLIYGFSWNNNLYNDYYEAYRTISGYSSAAEMTNADREFLTEFINNPTIDLDNANHFNYLSTQIESGKDFYRRNRDLTIIAMAALHVLNIIDATVDAHFFDYDISDDLSMRITPAPMEWRGSQQTVGVKVNITF